MNVLSKNNANEEVLELHHQIQFSVISRTSIGAGEGLPQCKGCSQYILSLTDRARNEREKRIYSKELTSIDKYKI